jgi:hypothetical protein
MPSQKHESLLSLFRNRPDLAPELLREALHVELPPYTEARIESAELTEIQPAEYRADMVVLLYRHKPVLGIVVEVQLAVDYRKRFSWPVYVVDLRARMRCPVCLLVFTSKDSVARWAAAPIDLGGGNRFRAFAVGPTGVPEITEIARAKADPELAVLSAMAHGAGPDPQKSASIALAAITASAGLDADRSKLYVDLVFQALGDAAGKSLRAMDPAKYEYQSEFAKKYVSQGRAEGRAEGRADIVLKLLTLKFGKLSSADKKRVQGASLEQLDRWAARVLTATTLGQVWRAPRKKR